MVAIIRTFMKLCLNIRFFLFGLLTVFYLDLPAQQFSIREVKTTEIPTETWISGMVQDSLGYMWLITGGTGVYRYDGYQFVPLKSQPGNSNTIASDRVEAIALDKDGSIWFGTYSNGLDNYNPSTNSFKHYKRDSADVNSLINDSIKCLLVDRDGILWIGTSLGIDRFDKKTGVFTHINEQSGLSNNIVRRIYEDKAGIIWIGTGEPFNELTPADKGGLNSLDKKTGRIIQYLPDKKNPGAMIDGRIGAIFEDSRGVFWVGTGGDGLHTMDRKTGIFTRHPYDPAHPEKLSRPPLTKNFPWAEDHISFIQEDNRGGILIGTFGAGISRFDPRTGNTTRQKDFKSTQNINPNNWWSYQSKDGIVWVSTFLGSLYQIDPVANQISFRPETRLITVAHQSEPGIYWLASDQGLIREDHTLGTSQIYPFDKPAVRSGRPFLIFGIAELPKGKLWLSTELGDIYNFNMLSGKYSKVNEGSKAPGKIRSIIDIAVDSSSGLWLGTELGLEWLNPTTGEIISYHGNLLSPANVVDIMPDRKGQIWVGSFLDDGITLFNRSDGSFTGFLKNKGISSNLLEDHDGIIWAGTNDALYFLKAGDKQFQVFPDQQIASNGIYGIFEDRNNCIWLASSKGLFKMSAGRDTILWFGESHGVGKNIFFPKEFFGYEGDQKTLLVSSQKGFLTFNPDELVPDITPPGILISGFTINSRSGAEFNYQLAAALAAGQHTVTLSHNENSFSFELISIHFAHPESNSASYMLENYDENWRQLRPGEKAYYNSLSPGEYLLHLRAYNANGIRSERTLTVIIRPPWWKTWWAYTLFAIFFVSAIWAFVFLRSAALKKENRLLEEKVSRRTAELNRSLADLKNTQSQLIQREKMASLGELTAGIAHEIQNPLNFINNFSDVNAELIDDMKTELKQGNTDEALAIADNIQKNENRINTHGKRADAIVKSMLEHSRVTVGEKQPVNINTLAEEWLRLAYHGYRGKDKNFIAELHTDLAPDAGKVSVVSQDIGRVFMNLFTNAFYSVAARKNRSGSDTFNPAITLTTKRKGNQVFISIKDNGDGVPEAVRDKIFQPFFTTKPTGQGTGLGLSIAYDIVKAHGGEISLNNGEDGAEFIIRLPSDI